MPMGCLVDQPRALAGASAQPHHVGLEPVDRLRRSTINEDQRPRIQPERAIAPCQACLCDIGAVLFGGMQGLFFSVRPSRRKLLESRAELAQTWCVLKSQACNSASVASGRAAL